MRRRRRRRPCTAAGTATVRHDPAWRRRRRRAELGEGRLEPVKLDAAAASSARLRSRRASSSSSRQLRHKLEQGEAPRWAALLRRACAWSADPPGRPASAACSRRARWPARPPGNRRSGLRESRLLCRAGRGSRACVDRARAGGCQRRMRHHVAVVDGCCRRHLLARVSRAVSSSIVRKTSWRSMGLVR